MKRREFIAGLGGAAVWPLLVRAQEQTKPIIGWIEIFPGGTPPEFLEAFRRGLAEFGFSDGRNVTVEFHNWERGEPLPALVADVVRQRPAAIFAIGVGAALAAKEATREIPIIFFRALIPPSWGWWRASIVRAAILRASPFLTPIPLENALICCTKRCRPLNQLLC